MFSKDYITSSEAADFLKLPLPIFKQLVSAGLIGESSPGMFRAVDIANKTRSTDFVRIAMKLKRETAAKRQDALVNPDDTEKQKSIRASNRPAIKRAPRQDFEGRRGR